MTVEEAKAFVVAAYPLAHAKRASWESGAKVWVYINSGIEEFHLTGCHQSEGSAWEQAARLIAREIAGVFY